MRTVRVSYHRTVNIGNYNSLKIGLDFEESFTDDALSVGEDESLYEECKETVLYRIKEELKRLKG